MRERRNKKVRERKIRKKKKQERERKKKELRERNEKNSDISKFGLVWFLCLMAYQLSWAI